MLYGSGLMCILGGLPSWAPKLCVLNTRLLARRAANPADPVPWRPAGDLSFPGLLGNVPQGWGRDRGRLWTGRPLGSGQQRVESRGDEHFLAAHWLQGPQVNRQSLEWSWAPVSQPLTAASFSWWDKAWPSASLFLNAQLPHAPPAVWSGGPRLVGVCLPRDHVSFVESASRPVLILRWGGGAVEEACHATTPLSSA